MAGRTLGLDLGPNSIGWALVDEDEHRIVDLGVRVFPEGVDNFDTKKERSRNEDRRIARGMRRQTKRRARRKRRLRDALITCGLFPSDPVEQDKLYRLNPYELRAKALDERLTPHEIGRVLLHLNQRRGFASNRKKDRGDTEVKGMLEEISNLAQQIEGSGSRTLGEYLFRKYHSLDHASRIEDDHVRNRHTRRSMLEREFDSIWNAQAEHLPELLTEQLRYGQVGRQAYPCKPKRRPKGLNVLKAFGIHGLIFFQRKMYWPKSVVGLCELEPKQKRCQRGDRHAQRFRLLQEVNNLRLIDASRNIERPLYRDERKLLLDKLSQKRELKFDEIRKLLGQLPDSPAPEQAHFNLERGKRTKLQGMVVDAMMATKSVAGSAWHKRSEDDKDSIVRMLLDNEREDDIVAQRLVDEFGFATEAADAALGLDFPPGYANLSLVAIDKLLPHLEMGLVYQSESDPEKSAIHAAGYLRRDELQRRLFDRLPDPTRMNPRDCPIGDIPNPVVKRALVELRKVVNAIIREYGKPDEVHVEMARSIRMGPKARSEYNSRIREREQQRDTAATEIRQLKQTYPALNSLRVNRDSILRYLLWEEQNHECLYCGQGISQQQLFGGDVDVDHVLPYSRCLDDSQANKLVCHRSCNHDKRNRTPYEWLADADPLRYERICQHAGSLMRKAKVPYGKYRKFLQKELDLDKFIARQLTDTAYICRVTAEYLRCLFDKDHHVLGLKGQHTAELRWQWGLNTILRDDDEDRKSRDDHRHHAVDAFVVAMTNRSRLQELSRTRKAGYFDRETGEVYEVSTPWEDFRGEVEKHVEEINVSHRVTRKIAGALHEDTHYGATAERDSYVYRKTLDGDPLSFSEIDNIRDVAIRKAVVDRLATHGVHYETGLKGKPGRSVWKAAFGDTGNPVRMKSRRPENTGVPIKKVRITKRDATIHLIRCGRARATYVKPGSTHHLCIFQWEENGEVRRDAEFVTMLEAVNRVKNRKTLIRRRPDPQKSPHIPFDASFVMSLSRGEMVVGKFGGDERLVLFNTAASTTRQMVFFEHTDARPRSQKCKFTCYPSTFEARKVTVDPLGRLRWARD
jgi:CRISPR-associated endonuclease Csn1